MVDSLTGLLGVGDATPLSGDDGNGYSPGVLTCTEALLGCTAGIVYPPPCARGPPGCEYTGGIVTLLLPLSTVLLGVESRVGAGGVP